MNLPERELLDAAPDAMVVVDEAGAILLVNRQTESMFGYSRDELLGQSVEILVPERFRARHPEHRGMFRRTPRLRPMGEGLTLRGRRKDGTEFPVEIALSPVEFDGGTVIASTIRDATFHVEREQNLMGILESTLNEIYIFDAATLRFVHANEGACRNLGYDLGELQELTPLDVKPEYTFDQFKDLIAPLCDGTRDQIVFTTVHRRKDRSTYPIEVHIQHGEFRNRSVLVAIILDITGRMEAERALRESHDALEQRVIERTTAFQAAAKEAERANVGKSRFLAAASHDLRQPLQSLSLYLSVQKRQIERQPIDICTLTEIGDKMRNSLDVMSELLDALLDISKLDSGSITPVEKDFPIQDLLDNLSAYGEQAAREKGIAFICAASTAVVHTDPVLLQRIIDNFVNNALRYTERGEVEVRCESRADSVRIEVKDSGVGIPQDALKMIFEEYFQLDNPARNRRKGLGLGLAIVKQIAGLLGLRVDVSSVPDQGSTFAVEVPLGEALTEPAAHRQTRRVEDDPRDRVVLLIDDDPTIVEAMTTVLEESGSEVHTALDADAAIAHVAAGLRPNILISDYRLPDLTGIELIRQVRDTTRTEIPAILMTGDTSFERIQAAGTPNCIVLHKPVGAEHLIEQIGNLSA